MAFAATEVSGRARDRHPDDALPSTRRPARLDSDGGGRGSGSGASGSGAGAGSGASRITSTTSLRAQLGERKRRSGATLFVAVGVALGAGAWMLWPRVDAADTGGTASSVEPDSGEADAAPLDAETTSVTPEAAAPALELDTAEEPDAAATQATPAAPTRQVAPLPAASEVYPPAPTYNPAWSILTNPPDAAGLVPPPTHPPASAPAPGADEAPPSDEPK